MRGFFAIILLICSNAFMTLAWYGHLKLKETGWASKLGIVSIVLLSWGIAFFEYCFQVPANRLGFKENGGPFSLLQLKMIQEVVSLSVFVIFIGISFKNEALKWNHLVGFFFLLLAVLFFFKGK